MKKTVTTLDSSIELTEERGSGNSTRQVNFVIDNLFKGNKVILLDHYCQGENRQANENLLNDAIHRLCTEFNFNRESKELIRCNINSHHVIFIETKFNTTTLNPSLV